MPTSSARPIKVLSTPKITSASGLSLVKIARLSAGPASASLMNLIVTLLSDSNFFKTLSLIAKASCVKIVSVRGPLGVGTAVGTVVGIAVGTEVGAIVAAAGTLVGVVSVGAGAHAVINNPKILRTNTDFFIFRFPPSFTGYFFDELPTQFLL